MMYNMINMLGLWNYHDRANYQSSFDPRFFTKNKHVSLRVFFSAA